MREADFRQAIADPGRADPHPRFAIHRNNVVGALAAALRVRYPVTAALLGAECFAAVARDFVVAGHLPASPVLIFYGAEFPDFAAAHAETAHLPCVGDLARLDSAWWRAYHAEDATALAQREFAGLAAEDFAGLRLAFHPSAAVLESPWPVGTIWQALRQGGDPGSFSAVAPQFILVWRPKATVRVHVIAAEQALFLSRLMNGAALDDTVEAGLAEQPHFDLARQLSDLIRAELIIRLNRSGTP